MNPITRFKQWYEEETQKSKVRIPSACCLSSIGLDGFPNSRFVSLKEIIDGKFVITGPLHSRKGIELLKDTKTALTFWWTETKRQVRIQGNSLPIEDQLADRYFRSRNRDSQIVSRISTQGMAIEDPKTLKALFQKQKSTIAGKDIERPQDWGGFYIEPERIEFMEFRESRLHLRELFTKTAEGWSKTFLQP